MILIIFVLSTLFLLGWFYVAMWYLRRVTHIRDEGAIVYFTTLFLVILGLVSDVFYNLTFGNIFGPPILMKGSGSIWKRFGRGEWTLSQRLARIRFEGSGWRLRLADYICERILNPKQPGYPEKIHC